MRASPAARLVTHFVAFLIATLSGGCSFVLGIEDVVAARGADAGVADASIASNDAKVSGADAPVDTRMTTDAPDATLAEASAGDVEEAAAPNAPDDAGAPIDRSSCGDDAMTCVVGGVFSLTGTVSAAASTDPALVGFEFGSRTCDSSGAVCIVGGIAP